MLYLTPDEMFARHRRLFAERRRLAGYVRWKLSNWRAMKERDQGALGEGRLSRREGAPHERSRA
jgi:hypothetical protein